MSKTLLALFLAPFGLFAAGCSPADDEPDDSDLEPTPDAATPATDAGTPPAEDAAAPAASDASVPPPDAGPRPGDASAPATDAATSDAGDDPDAAPPSSGDAGFGLVDAGVDAGAADAAMGDAGGPKTLIDVNDVSANPEAYEWFDFRPNLLKLILSGAAETEHIAILWYTVTDGTVGLHYHAQTESVFTIDGTQTDAKGVYPSGTVYFNPPGSGHEISDSSGFFILAYASPPDFANTDLIEEYTPIQIDTTGPDFTTTYPFVESGTGVRSYQVPLDPDGGMSAAFMEFVAPAEPFEYTGNYVLVLDGSCELDGMLLGSGMLLVTKDVTPLPFTVTAADASACLTMAISF